MRVLRWSCAAFVVFVSFARVLFAQEVERSLWIDPRKLDLSDHLILENVFKLPVQRYVISCFTRGETLLVDPQGLFPQMKAYQGKPDVLGTFIKEAHTKGRRVYLFYDCLLWATQETEPERDPFRRRMDLLERPANAYGNDPIQEKYASPAHPVVRSQLLASVGNLIKEHSELDGLVLRCSLSKTSTLGFSKTSRLAFMRAHNIDPLTITPEKEGKESPDQTHWRRWRADLISSLVKELAERFQQGNPKGQVAIIGFVNHYQLSAIEQMRSGEDPLGWVRAAPLNEIILDWPEARKEFAAGFEHYTASVAKSNKGLKISVWPRPAGKQPFVELSQVANSTHRSQLDGTITQISTSEDLAALSHYFSIALAKVETILHRRDLQILKDDPRLRVPLTINLRQPRLNDILAKLQVATKVTITADRATEFMPSLAVFTAPAWSVMQDLAMDKRIQGRWETTENGYLLVLSTDPSSTQPPPRFHFSSILVVSSIGVLIIICIIIAAKKVRGTVMKPGPR